MFFLIIFYLQMSIYMKKQQQYLEIALLLLFYLFV